MADNRGICPVGWHIPTDSEWTILINFLGGSSQAGGKLKETGTAYWISPNVGATNESGFSALPAGRRVYNGDFQFQNLGAYFWSSTGLGGVYALETHIQTFYSIAFTDYGEKTFGFSVRCLKD